MDVQAEFYPLHVPEGERQRTHVWGIANVAVEGVHIMNIRAINYRMEDGQWGHFFSYPQIKVGDEYQDVVRLSKVQKMEIEMQIKETIRESILKETPDIYVDSVTIVEHSKPLVAVASVQVNKIRIDHVRLFQKDGQYFVKMPQYQKNGEWKPLIELENPQFTIPEVERCVKEEYEARAQQRLEEQARHRKERGQQGKGQQPEKAARGKTIC